MVHRYKMDNLGSLSTFRYVLGREKSIHKQANDGDLRTVNNKYH